MAKKRATNTAASSTHTHTPCRCLRASPYHRPHQPHHRPPGGSSAVHVPVADIHRPVAARRRRASIARLRSARHDTHCSGKEPFSPRRCCCFLSNCCRCRRLRCDFRSTTTALLLHKSVARYQNAPVDRVRKPENPLRGDVGPNGRARGRYVQSFKIHFRRGRGRAIFSSLYFRSSEGLPYDVCAFICGAARKRGNSRSERSRPVS